MRSRDATYTRTSKLHPSGHGRDSAGPCIVLGDLVGYGADPNAVVERIRALAPHAIIRGNHDKVGAGIEIGRGLQRRGPQRHPLDPRDAHRRQPRVAGRRCPPDRWPLTSCLRDLPRHARMTKTPTSSTISTRSAPCTPRGGRSACSATPTSRSATASLHNQFAVETAERRAGRSTSRCGRGEVSDQSGFGGTAARRRPAGRVRDRGHRDAPRSTIHRIAYPVERAQARIVEAGLPEILARTPGCWDDRIRCRAKHGSELLERLAAEPLPLA